MGKLVRVRISVGPRVDDSLTISNNTGGLSLTKQDGEGGGPEFGSSGCRDADMGIETQGNSHLELIRFVDSGSTSGAKRVPTKWAKPSV
jgi:hypothetical protein